MGCPLVLEALAHGRKTHSNPIEKTSPGMPRQGASKKPAWEAGPQA